MKAGIVALFAAIAAGRHETVSAMVAPDYVPHTASLNDVPTLEPGRAALRNRLIAHGPIGNQVHRIVIDDDLAFVHVRYDGEVPVSAADIFRFDAEGLIAEHWNARQRIGQDLATGVDRFAGGGDADLPTDEERRGRMKQVMRDVLIEMWGKGDAALVPTFYDPAYIQHNPDMPGGYTRIVEVVENNIRPYIAATGTAFPIDIHRMGAAGDLIFVHYSIFMAGINRSEGARSTNVDIFRIDAADRMIEHWDVLQIEGEPLPDDRTLF